MKKLVLFIITILWSVLLSAQTYTVTADFLSDKDKVVKDQNGTWHALKGVNVKFIISITPSEGDNIQEAYYEEDGELKRLELDDTETYSYVIVNNNLQNDYSFGGNILYQVSGATEDTPRVECTLSGNPVSVKVYNEPKVLQIDTVADTRYVNDDDGTGYQLFATVSGGNNDGWKYQIDDNEWVYAGAPENDMITITIPGNVDKRYAANPYSIKLCNKAIGSDEVNWMDGYKTAQSIFFYITPQLSENAPGRTNFYRNTQGNEWAVKVTTGDPNLSHYTYEWSGGTNTNNTSSSYCPFMSDVTTRQMGKTVSVNWVYSPNGHETSHKDQINFNKKINVYEELLLKTNDSFTSYTYADNPVSFNGETNNYPNGWVSYRWSRDNEGLPDKTSSTIQDIPTFKDGTLEVFNYTLTAILKPTGETESWDSKSLTFTANVYPKPQGNLVQRLVVKNSQNTDDILPEGTETGVPVGTSFTFDSTSGEATNIIYLLPNDKLYIRFSDETLRTGFPELGSTSGWYISADDFTKEGDSWCYKAPTYTGSKKPKITISNKHPNANDNNRFDYVYTFKVEVLPAPSMNTSNNGILGCYAGDEYTTSDAGVFFKGGHNNTETPIGDNDGWNFVWNGEGIDFKDPQGLTTTFIAGNNDQEYSVNGTYTLYGVERYSDDRQLSLTVYSRPSVHSSLSSTQINPCKNGDDDEPDFQNEEGDVGLDTPDKEFESSDSIYSLNGDELNLRLDLRGGAKTSDGYESSSNWNVTAETDENLNVKGQQATGYYAEKPIVCTNVTSESGEQSTYTLSVKHGEGRVQTPFQARIIYHVTTFKEPRLIIGRDEYNLYSGNQAEVKTLDTDGGDPEGWTASWYDENNEPLGDTLRLSEIVTKKTTRDYRYKATYTCMGVKRYEDEMPVHAVIWPEPKATLSGSITANVSVDANFYSLIDYQQEDSVMKANMNESTPSLDTRYLLPGDEVTVKIDHEGGIDEEDADYWQIESCKLGTVDLQQVEGKDNEFWFTASKQASSNNLIVKIVNGKQEDENGQPKAYSPYEATFTIPFNVLEELSVPNLTEVIQPEDSIRTYHHVYSGETATLNAVVPNGGNKQFWSSEWTPKDETTGATAIDKNEKDSIAINLTTTLSDEQQKGMHYKQTWTYNMYGVERCSQANDYHVFVWKQPEIERTGSITVTDYQQQLQTVIVPNLTLKFADANADKDSTATSMKMIVGDKLVFNVNPSAGITDESAWTVKVEVDGKPIEKKEDGYHYIPEVSGEHTIKVKATNGEGLRYEPYERNLSQNFIVYKAPSLDTNTTTYNTFKRHDVTFTCLKKDGVESSGLDDPSNGWKYTWWKGEESDKQGEAPTLTSDYTLVQSPLPDCLSMNKTTYQCLVENICEGITRFRKTVPYTLITWPEPEIKDLTVKLKKKDVNADKGETSYFNYEQDSEKSEIPIECFENDRFVVTYKVHGGYTGKSGAWHMMINESDNNIHYTIANAEIAQDSQETAINTLNGSPKSLKLSVWNDCVDADQIDAKWFQKDYSLNVTTYPEGVITPNLKDSLNASWVNNATHMYEGRLADFKFNKNEAYNSGWSFVWTDEKGKEIHNEKDYPYTAIIDNGEASQDHTLTLHVTNKIGENYSLDEKYLYKVRVWKNAIMPESFSLTNENYYNEYGQKVGRSLTETNMKIREGNTLQTATDEIQFGYLNKDYYRYVWNDLSDYSKYTWTTTVAGSNKNDKDKTSYTRTGHIEVRGPYQKVWDRVDFEPQTITVYNKPKTPQNLMRKGNGNSGTMICTTTISETDLIGKEYYLVFGYIGNDGKRHDYESIRQEEPGQIRWNSNFTTDQMNLPNSSLYVYALWKYDESDGTVSEVTSGLCYACSANGTSQHNETWDTSEYDLPSASTRAGGDYVLGLESLQYGSSDAEVQSVYSVNGIKTNRLTKGINIVRMSDGSVRKMYVK